MLRIDARARYWAQHPPVHLLVQGLAIFFGMESAKPRMQDMRDVGTVDDLRAMYPGGVTTDHLRG